LKAIQPDRHETFNNTILAQLASEKIGVPLDKVEVILGDTSFPAGPISGGSMPFADLLRRANLRRVGGSGKGEGTYGNPDAKFSTHSFGCHFVEVTWQPQIARFRVSRVVTVMDAGRILNPLAARNQIEGAFVMGIGMALLEHTS
jgi:CO/xanthine dehydrogenase Mo-binding subunit